MDGRAGGVFNFPPSLPAPSVLSIPPSSFFSSSVPLCAFKKSSGQTAEQGEEKERKRREIKLVLARLEFY